MKKNRKILTVLFSGVVLLLLGLFLLLYTGQPTELEVTFFDIGQGDSILIETPAGHNILIDGGPDRSILAKLGRELPFYDHAIDVMILTHAHSDHVAGLVEVLKRYKVGTVLYVDVSYSSPDYIEWRKFINEKEIELVMPKAGQVFNFGQVRLEILYPFEYVAQKEFKDLNDSSIVARLDYQDTSFLFTGDAPVEVEEELLRFYSQVGAGAPTHPFTLESDVLKIGHHGSKYSSSLEFLHAVSPEYAVIQSKVDNKFGHPHRLIIKRLEGLGVQILRNDEAGDIKMKSDGEKVWLE